MRRFEYDDNDDFFKDDLENFFDEGPDDYHIPKGELINVLQLDLVEADLNMRLLALTVKTLEKTFLWRFRKLKTKMKMIREMYNEMVNLVDRVDKDTKETGDAAV